MATIALTHAGIGNGKFEVAAPKHETSVYRKDSPPDIKAEARDLLIKYSGVVPDEVDAHVQALVRVALPT
jgi:hypothetical protein